MKLKKIKTSTINKKNFHNIFFPSNIQKEIIPQSSESYTIPIDNKNINRRNVFINIKQNTNKNNNNNYISNYLNNFLSKKLNQNRILIKIRNKSKNSEFLFKKLKQFSLTKRSYSSTTRNKNKQIKSSLIYENIYKNKLNITQNLKPLSFYSPYLLGYRENSLRINLQNKKYKEYSLYYNNISSNSNYSSISNSNMKKSKSYNLIF